MFALQEQPRLAHLIDRLRQANYRLTPQRLAVLAMLASTRVHPTVQQIFDAVRRDFPTTSLATIYKTIEMLKSIGEVLEVQCPGGYSRYDGRDADPHPHVTCIACGRTEDVEVAGIARMAEEVAGRSGYALVGPYVFQGRCPSCQELPLRRGPS